MPRSSLLPFAVLLRRWVREFSIPRTLGHLFGTTKDQEAASKAVERALRAQIAGLEADRDQWRTLAQQAIAYQQDQNNRLLLSKGIQQSPANEPRMIPAQPEDVYDSVKWENDDFRHQVEEKAQMALGNPALEAYFAEAALYDSEFKAVHDRITELSRR